MKTEYLLKNSFPFLRTKKCAFCSIYSIPTRPGIYFLRRESNEIFVTSNKPNQIFEAINSKKPHPMVLALDTAGFSINEARALGKIDPELIDRIITEILTEGNNELYLPDSIVSMLPTLVDHSNVSVLELNNRIDSYERFNKYLIRCLVGLRLGIAYSLFILPFMLIDVDLSFRSILVFLGSIFFSTVILPRNMPLNLIVFLLFGVFFSNLLFINHLTGSAIILVLINTFIGLLWGGLAWIIINR